MKGGGGEGGSYSLPGCVTESERVLQVFTIKCTNLFMQFNMDKPSSLTLVILLELDVTKSW